MKGNSRSDVAVLILRVGLGLMLMYFGAQKVFGLFGGPGFNGTIDVFQSQMGISKPFTILAMAGELLGGLGMVVGLLTSVASFGAVCTMAVATYETAKPPGAIESMLHGGHVDVSKPFFSGAILIGALAVTIMGGGRYSLDAKFSKKGKVRR